MMFNKLVIIMLIKKQRVMKKRFDLYSQIIERMPVHIYWKDKHFNYIDCNKVFAKYLGFATPKEIIGRSDYDFLCPDEANIIRENDKQVLTLGNICVFEEDISDSLGKKTTYLTQKIPLFNTPGDIIGLAGISINITTRKALEEKAHADKEATEHRLFNILNNLPGHVYWKNKDSIYQGCNLAQAQSAGFSNPEQMIGKSDFDMPWSHEAESLREMDLCVMQRKDVITREEASKLANSDKVSIFLSKKAPLLDINGEIDGVLGISFDISDRKKMEEELAKSQVAAEAANLAKTEFLRNMEHQLRTPFSGIYSLIEFLASKETDPEKKMYLKTVHESAKEFVDLLNDILEFTRNETGNSPILEMKFNLYETLSQVVKLEQATALAKGIDLTLNYPEALPEVFLGDPYRIKRLMMNLISNAIKFTEHGHVSCQVRLGERVDSRHWILQLIVSDTGIGISEEKQLLIYEKFFRLFPANQNKYKGAGLGLYVVKQIIHELEGEIEVQSELNKGTTFICTLPFKSPLLFNDNH